MLRGHGGASNWQALVRTLESQHLQVGAIRRACNAVEEYLSANRDNLRSFFDKCFPVLLKRIFGYDDAEASWLNLVSKAGRADDARALLQLLSPRGRLLTCMFSADAEQLIKFMFPVERLPPHTQVLLSSPAGRQLLASWPQYAGHIHPDASGRVQVYLNVFGYFMFWTAFYVLRGRALGPDQPGGGPRPPSAAELQPGQWPLLHMADLRRMGHSLLPGAQPGCGPLPPTHPYTQLLHLFLTHYLPRSSPATASPAPNPGALLLSILLEFWLTDVAEPGPPPSLAAATPQGGPPRPLEAPSMAVGLRALSYQPPSDEVLEALTLLTRYIYVQEEGAANGAQQSQPAWLPESPVRTLTSLISSRGGGGGPGVPPQMLASQAAGPAVQAYARKLYRYLRRAFAQWPLASSSSLAPLLQLWLAVITPWHTPGAAGQQGQPAASQPAAQRPWGPAAPARSQASGQGQRQEQPQGYTPAWRSHVLSHLPFYTLLLPKFLELIYARLSFRGDAAATELLLVARALAASGPGLQRELQAAESAFNSFLAAGSRRAEGPLAELLPWWLEQAADWEAAAAAGAPASPPLQVDVSCQLFTGSSGSATHLAALVLRAAHAQVRPALREALSESLVKALPVQALNAEDDTRALQYNDGGADSQRYPRAGIWSSVQYRGDWLKRPIASNEIAPLVRLLVVLSDRINAQLGLSEPWRGEEEEEPAETVVQEGLYWLRRRGYRVSLRPLAEVQTLAWLLGAAFVARCIGSLVFA
ncbi:hypothetical protein QJQ45_015584 [Haematococcus lacustris]|nr:hypothetical protein QJQ45_015584 [Haematococcus lacustris]